MALTRGLAADHARRRAAQRLAGRPGTHTGIDGRPDLRWAAVHRLAALGDALAPTAIDDERLADGTIVGDLGAAARAGRAPRRRRPRRPPGRG